MMNKPLNKQELIAAVAEKSDLSKSKATEAVNAVFDALAHALVTRGEIRLIGFGTFVTIERKATKGRNPKTKEEIHIPASTSVRFRAGKDLKDSVNKAGKSA